MEQTNQQDSSLASSRMRAAAFSVHIFTALGAGIALIAQLERLAARSDGAVLLSRLHEAALADEEGAALERELAALGGERASGVTAGGPCVAQSA